MHPILLQVGPLTVYSYGVMVALAIMICVFFLNREVQVQGLDPDVIFDFIFCIIISGIIGSRIFFVILNFSFFKENILEIFMIHHGGLAWQGGWIFASFTGLIFIYFKKLPLWKTLDLIIPYAALGHGIGRIGCFLNGCCEGRPWENGIFFPVHGDRLHPTQLYSAFALVGIFFILKILQRVHLREGQIFFIYFFFAAAKRFFLQFLRADYYPLFGGIGIFQIISLIVFFLALYGNIYVSRRS